MSITGWKGTHYVHHDVAEPGVWHFKVAGVDQLFVLFNPIAGNARFNENFNISFELGPIVFAYHS